jgi:hypothetical protein
VPVQTLAAKGHNLHFVERNFDMVSVHRTGLDLAIEKQ